MLEIILRRHEARSTIMTSSRPADEWGKLLGDVPTAGAILDRWTAPGGTDCHQWTPSSVGEYTDRKPAPRRPNARRPT